MNSVVRTTALTPRQVEAAARVAIIGCSDVIANRLGRCIASMAQTVVVHDPLDLAELAVDLVILGHGSRSTETILAYCGPLTPLILVVNADAAEPAIDPRVFYVLHSTLGEPAVVAVVRSALRRAPVPPSDGTLTDARTLQRILIVSAQFVGARDLAAASRIAELAIQGMVDADRVHCLYHDPESAGLWSETDAGREGRGFTGIAGFVARTGEAAIVDRADADPRYVAHLDDPGADGKAHLLVVPVADRSGQVHAVFIAARGSARPTFSADDRCVLESLAFHAGPMMHHLALLVDVEARLRSRRDRIFRRESLQAHAAPGNRGDVVRVSPHWIRWAYWVLVVLAVLSALYLVVGEVEQYSTGTAIVRVHDRTEVAAQSAGPLIAVDVVAGQHVEANATLARLDDTELQAELTRVRRELDAQLRKRMLDPSDEAAADALISLRGAERGVLDRLALREIKAPHAGTVSDLRMRAGQHIEVGDIMMSLIGDDQNRRVVALLPGGDRPQLRAGMPLRLELDGYRYAYQSLVIESVSDEVIGPTEVQRFLGPQVGDAVVVPGPVVVVEAALESASFEADGATFEYHDGMQRVAEVGLRSESILEAMFPPLKRLHAHD